MRLGRSLAAGAVAALLLISVAVPVTLGYQGQVPFQVTVTGPSGSISCGTPLTLTATVLDSNGKPVASRAVAWSFGAGRVDGDQIGKVSTTTNAQGVTPTTVTLACVAGDRTIVATAAPATGQLTIGSGQLVLGITGTPVTATPTPTPSEIATPTPVASEIAVASISAPSAVATAPPGAPTTGSSSGNVPLWVWILIILLIVVLLILVVLFILRRGVVG
jgi:hypothetical protein